MIASVGRYFVRWRTSTESGELRIVGWDVCDARKFDNIEVAKFSAEEKDKAVAIAKLLNTQGKHEEQE